MSARVIVSFRGREMLFNPGPGDARAQVVEFLGGLKRCVEAPPVEGGPVVIFNERFVMRIEEAV